MRRIPLTKGKEALVDDCDYEFLMQWSWHVGGYKNRYARRNTSTNGLFYMHTVIAERMGLILTEKQVDHRDRDGLNNQRFNLRPATRSQNQSNRCLSAGNTSGFRGVRRHRHRWQAVISVGGKSLPLGTFDTPAQAAKAYNQAAKKYFGEFACLNPV